MLAGRHVPWCLGLGRHFLFPYCIYPLQHHRIQGYPAELGNHFCVVVRDGIDYDL